MPATVRGHGCTPVARCCHDRSHLRVGRLELRNFLAEND